MRTYAFIGISCPSPGYANAKYLSWIHDSIYECLSESTLVSSPDGVGTMEEAQSHSRSASSKIENS